MYNFRRFTTLGLALALTGCHFPSPQQVQKFSSRHYGKFTLGALGIGSLYVIWKKRKVALKKHQENEAQEKAELMKKIQDCKQEKLWIYVKKDVGATASTQQLFIQKAKNILSSSNRKWESITLAGVKALHNNIERNNKITKMQDILINIKRNPDVDSLQSVINWIKTYIAETKNSDDVPTVLGAFIVKEQLNSKEKLNKENIKKFLPQLYQGFDITENQIESTQNLDTDESGDEEDEEDEEKKIEETNTLK